MSQYTKEDQQLGNKKWYPKGSPTLQKMQSTIVACNVAKNCRAETKEQ